MRTSSLAVLAVMTVAACGDANPLPTADPLFSAQGGGNGSSNAAAGATHRYQVTITNLTTGQPLSPGVLVTHTRAASLFTAGLPSSAGVREIAENGSPTLAAVELQDVPGVFGIFTTEAPVGRQGGGPFPSTLTLEIAAAANANFLSLSLMLICTNDGFAGLDAVRLPGGFAESVYYAQAYDAGSELNDEVAGSIVPPCFGIGPVMGPVGGAGHGAEGGVVGMHQNIQGSADLTSAHAWDGPVARVSVRRIR